MKKTFLLLMAIVATGSAYAHPLSSHFYADVFSGVNLMENLKGNESELELKTGYVVGGAVGYRFTPFLSLEGEVAYRHNTLGDLKVSNYLAETKGHFQTISAMVNGICQMPISNGAIIPYVGAGLGNRWDELKMSISPITTSNGTYTFSKAKEEKHGCAYQAIVGADFAAWCNTRVGAEYRYQNRFTSDPGNHSIDLKLSAYF